MSLSFNHNVKVLLDKIQFSEYMEESDLIIARNALANIINLFPVFIKETNDLLNQVQAQLNKEES